MPHIHAEDLVRSFPVRERSRGLSGALVLLARRSDLTTGVYAGGVTAGGRCLWFLSPVIEDRGQIGIGGQQIVRLEALDEEDFEPEPRRFELAAAEVELEQPAAK